MIGNNIINKTMGKKNALLLFGIGSILILIASQLIFIGNLWKQSDEMLTLRYRLLSQEATATLRGPRSLDVYDSVRFFLEGYSAEAIKELEQINSPDEMEKKKREVLLYFSTILNLEQELSEYLSNYFESAGFEKKFNHRIDITNLEMIGKDTIRIYRNASFIPRRPGGRPTDAPALNESKASILVQRYWMEDNYYSLYFDYYIDFSDKRRMILAAISASLIMSIVSIIAVVGIFMFTYRNLMEERRLSGLKTDFINNMTHELKTPLATITVAGKTLEMEKIRKDDAKILETAKLIGKQSVHLNQLINMILEISMWERAQFELDRKRVDVGELLEEIVASFSAGHHSTAVLRQKYDFKGVTAELDTVYFTTLINNLLSNAVKYSDKEPVIDVEGFIENNNIYIKVSDNGIGISKLDQKHVFDKFYRASSGNIHKFKGLGLGLYYVKKIATAHGGDVSVSSKPGKGSIFTITLPVN